jgi:hypothetical protein
VIPTTNAEQDVLKTLLRSGKSIELTLPENLDAREIGSYLRHSFSMLSKVELSRDKLKAVIGRLLVLAQKNPEVWQKQGFDSSEEMIQDLKKKYKISRSTLFEIRACTKAFPKLTLEQVAAVGSQNLVLLSKFSKQENSDAPKLLKWATENTHEKLKEILVSKGYLGDGEADGASITLTGSLAEIKELRRYLAREDLQEYAGKGITMILAALNEAEAEWTSASKGVAAD